jgi:excisionase family DNA binding protein
MSKYNVQIGTYSCLEALTEGGFGRDVFYRAVKNGVIPSIRIGRTIRIPKLAYDRILAEGLPTPPADATPPKSTGVRRASDPIRASARDRPPRRKGDHDIPHNYTVDILIKDETDDRCEPGVATPPAQQTNFRR